MLYRPHRANIMKIFKLNGVFSGVFIIIGPEECPKEEKQTKEGLPDIVK